MAEAAATGTAPATNADGESQSASQQALDMLAGDTSTGTGENTDNTPKADTSGPKPEAKPDSEAADTPETDDSGIEPEPEDLGDAGKRAIARMKTERSNAIRAQKRAEAALAERDKTIAEQAQTIKQLKVENLASGKLREPALALKLLTDLNGSEDDKTITKAIDKLISEHPYLAPDHETDSRQTDPDGLAELLPGEALKPADRNQVNAAQFGEILSQLGISI